MGIQTDALTCSVCKLLQEENQASSSRQPPGGLKESEVQRPPTKERHEKKIMIVKDILCPACRTSVYTGLTGTRILVQSEISRALAELGTTRVPMQCVKFCV